eukprot:6982400-Prymnesium_polylepis.2
MAGCSWLDSNNMLDSNNEPDRTAVAPCLEASVRLPFSALAPLGLSVQRGASCVLVTPVGEVNVPVPTGRQCGVCLV